MAEFSRQRKTHRLPDGARRPFAGHLHLNTHSTACLYEALDPARRIAERLEWHFTPKHGSWLNMAEIEFDALSKQCLGRRIGSMCRLKREVAAWEEDRNERMVGVNWRFNTVTEQQRF